MKLFPIILSMATASLAPLWATVNISGEFGSLRDVNNSVITNSTLYAIVYDTNNDSLMPGGLGLNESLLASDSSAAFSAFSGQTLTQGLVIGGDTVVKFGTFSHPQGVVSPVISTTDFLTSGVTESANRLYGLYWFPGISSSAIPALLTQVGGINETVDYFSDDPDLYIGMRVPADGKALNTVIVDSILSTDRFRAIAVPEPATVSLSVLGLAALLRRRRN